MGTVRPSRRTLIRIVQLSSFHERCGVGTYTEALASELTARGAELRILSPKRRAGDAGRGEQPPRMWSRGSATVLQAFRVFASIAGMRPNVVHLQVTPALFSPRFVRVLAALCRAARIPVVATLHGREAASGPGSRRLQRLLAALRGTDLVVHNGRHAAELSRDRVHVIPHGVPEASAAEVAGARAALGVNPSALVIAHVGFLLPDKGIDEVIHAVAALRHEMPRLSYWVVGGIYANSKSRAYFASLRSLIEALRLQDRIRLTGEFVSEELARLELEAADWVVLNYRTGNDQGTSGAARFALSVGRPVAVSRAPVFDDLREAVHTLEGPLECSLRAILGDGPLSESTRARGIAFCRRHSWRASAERHLDLYESVQRAAALRRARAQ